MKHKILLFLLIALGLATTSMSIAQPILTATGINPIVGDRFDFHYTNYINPGDSGINQTWDLTSMDPGIGTYTKYAFNTTSTILGSYYPSSNIAIGSGYNIEDYFITSSSALQYDGHAYQYDTLGYAHLYSKPQDILHFPFTYGNSFSDSSTGIAIHGMITNDIDDLMMNTRMTAKISAGTSTYHDAGFRTAVADGYGTLKTPAGTFNNVLRVHYTDQRIDSYYGAYNIEMYAWFKEGVHYPLVVIDDSASAYLHFQANYCYYLDNIDNGVNEHTNAVNSCYLFPNPTSDYLRIQSSTVKLNNSTIIVITNALGEVFKTEKQESGNGLILNTKNLSSGIYFVEVITNNVRWTGKFIKE